MIQFKYIHDTKALWTGDYFRGLSHQVIPYSDDNEDQDVDPGRILNYGCKDELSVDDGMYDGHSIYDIPCHRNVEPPWTDMCVLLHLGQLYALIFGIAAVWATGMAFFTTAKGFAWKVNR